MNYLARVADAREAYDAKRLAFEHAIYDAWLDGHSLRAIADVAGMSHMAVQRIVLSQFPNH